MTKIQISDSEFVTNLHGFKRNNSSESVSTLHDSEKIAHPRIIPPEIKA